MTLRPSAPASNQDIFMKLRMRKILFAEGYWTPLEVELSQYEDQSRGNYRRRTLTDLDVLGVRFDRLLDKDIVVVDCKSGGSVSDPNRLFWLKGVREYFGADQGYLIRPQVELHARAIAPKLGLRVLSDNELSDLEKSLNISNVEVPIDDLALYSYMEGEWKAINVKLDKNSTKEQVLMKKVKNYLDYSYWYMDNSKNFLRIPEEFSEISFFLSDKVFAHLLMGYLGLERFVYASLDLGSRIQAQGLSDIPRFAKSNIYGGVSELRSREKLFEILHRAGIQENLDPIWLEEGIELIGRMIRNPDGSKDVLRYIQGTLISKVAAGHENLTIYRGQSLSSSALSLARDAAITFSRITGIDRKIYTSILEM